MPDEAVFIAPLARPRVHGRHGLPSQYVEPINHISQVESLRAGERHLDEVGVLQMAVAAEVVDHRHPLDRGWGRGRRARRRLVATLARRFDPDLVPARARAGAGAGAAPPRPPLHPLACCGGSWFLAREATPGSNRTAVAFLGHGKKLVPWASGIRVLVCRTWAHGNANGRENGRRERSNQIKQQAEVLAGICMNG